MNFRALAATAVVWIASGAASAGYGDAWINVSADLLIPGALAQLAETTVQRGTIFPEGVVLRVVEVHPSKFESAAADAIPLDAEFYVVLRPLANIGGRAPYLRVDCVKRMAQTSQFDRTVRPLLQCKDQLFGAEIFPPPTQIVR